MKPSRLAGWASIRRSAPGSPAANSSTGAADRRAPWLRLLLRPTAPPPVFGLIVGVAAIAAETVLVVLLKRVAPGEAFGTIYLVGVLVVSSVWGLGLSVAVSLASALALAYFRNWPAGGFMPLSLENGVAVAIFVVVALCANLVAGLARARAIEADQRRREADLAADLARVMLGAGDLTGALDTAAQHLAQVLELAFASLELGAIPAEGGREAVPLHEGAKRVGTLLIPADLPEMTKRRLHERLAPALEALLRAALEREAINDDLMASHDQMAVLAEQQAALRHVATLIARGASSAEVFSTVADEIARCLNAGNASINRFEGDEVVVLALSHLDPQMPYKPVIGERHTLEGDNIATRVLQTGRPARFDVSELRGAAGSIAARLREIGLRCAIGAPIVVNGRVWGMAAVGSSAPDPLPPDAGARIGDFADLVATAIANAEARFQLQASRDSLDVLARQQCALRRVATQVARGVGQAEVFTAVAEEMARCLGVENAEVFRIEADGGAVVVASYAEPGEPHLPVGDHVTLEGDNVGATVLRTGRAARMDDYGRASGSLAARLRQMGVRCRVGAPIVVDERVWGMAVIGSSRPEPLPDNIEDRIAEFADLVATAIAAATTRTDLIASRARIVTAADDARRRLERDLHDGAQQRLISLGLQLRMAEDSMPAELQDHKQQLSEIVSGLTAVSGDLQEISRGIHPAILSRGGLSAAFKTLARRSAVPVTLDLRIDRRFADSIEVATYYVVAEALTNAAKHAQAKEVAVSARVDDDRLDLSIRDDGIGGADSRKGSGLIGLKDRVEALGGQIDVTSPRGRGTSLRITIPVKAPELS
jgi:signal transduction histidine kinase/uncharacterized protein YoaH (UPF0181 family)